MTVAGDLAPVTDQLAVDLRGQVVADLLDTASYRVKLAALDVAEAVTGGDRRLSRFGGRTRGRVRLGVRYTVAGTQSVIELKPAGMWSLTTQGARPHLIGAGRRTARGRYVRRRGRTLLRFPSGDVRTGPVQHPGTRGRGSLARVYAQVPAIVADAFSDVLNDRLG